MKLWHKDLIPALSKTLLKQLLKDCIRIISFKFQYGEITTAEIRGAYPFSTLRVNEYDTDNLLAYTRLVCQEIEKRHYDISESALRDLKRLDIINVLTNVKGISYQNIPYNNIFKGWHNYKYLKQCYYIIEEMYDCGVYSRGDLEKAKKILRDKSPHYSFLKGAITNV